MARIDNGHHIWRAQDCLLCGAATSERVSVCVTCRADLPQAPSPACPRCARPSPTGTACGACLTHPPHVDNVRAALRYTFPLDRLIQAYKYGHRLALAAWFGEEINRLGADLSADRIVPVPLHPERLRERGFNQAVELARALSRARGTRLDTALIERQRATLAQADQPPVARQNNVRNAFFCHADLGGEHILLIDDVMTSGATLNECARLLKLHGARRVDALVLARALPAHSA